MRRRGKDVTHKVVFVEQNMLHKLRNCSVYHEILSFVFRKITDMCQEYKPTYFGLYARISKCNCIKSANIGPVVLKLTRCVINVWVREYILCCDTVC